MAYDNAIFFYLADNAILICRLLILTFCIDFDNDELAGGTTPIQRTIVPYRKDAIGLGSIIHRTKSKKNHGDGDQFVDNYPCIDERKPLSTTVKRGVLNDGDHTLIPVMARMIHSAVWDSKRFVLKDGQPLHMVNLVGAVRNFCEKIKHVQIDVEDGTGLMQVILWRKEKECMAQRQMIHDCNSTYYIHVIGEVEDYYGVHKIIAFDV
jgi:hypothetical protein